MTLSFARVLDSGVAPHLDAMYGRHFLSAGTDLLQKENRNVQYTLSTYQVSDGRGDLDTPSETLGSYFQVAK